MVHVSQFYPCSEVSLAAELYYICELGKYSRLSFGHPVSLDGVVLKSVLRKSPIWQYFRLAVNQGWIVNHGVEDDDFPVTSESPLMLDDQTCCNIFICTGDVRYDAKDRNRRREDYMYNLMTPIQRQISFETMKDDYWLWSMGGENNSKFLVNNQTLNNNRSDQAWLSVIAMVAANRFFLGVPRKLLLKISSQALLNESSVAYILLLSEETPCLLNWCEFYFDVKTVSEARKRHLGYVSWYAKGRDIGMCDRWYSGKEKLAYLRDTFDIDVGDLVMFYTRSKAQKQNYIKSIDSCHLAKIIKLNEQDIHLELINTTKPFYHSKLDFDDHTMAVKRMFMDKLPYTDISVTQRRLTFIDVGVEYMLYTEPAFIVPLSSAQDMREVIVTNGRTVDKLYLEQNDLIYWILKDYEYDFNEARFLDKYFKDREPLRTRYLRGDELEPELFVTEE